MFTRDEIFYNSEQEWLDLRKEVITSTNMSCLFKLNKYRTLMEYYYERAENFTEEYKETERSKWGNRLESAIANGIAEDEGWEITPFKSFMKIPELRIGSSFDFKILKNDKRPDQTGVLEIKNVDGMIFKDEWTVENGEVIEAPPMIELQAQHELFVSGLDYIVIAVFVGGNKPYWILREPDPEIFDAIAKKAKWFNGLIDTKTRPEIDWEADAEFIARLYNTAEPNLVLDAKTDEDLRVTMINYFKVSQQIKDLEAKKDACKAYALTKIGSASKVLLDIGSITAGTVGESTYSVTRKPYRMFRLNLTKQAKEELK